MSHITKVFLRIIMIRGRSKIEPEISQKQCGFVKDNGTRNAILLMRTLAERSIQVQQDLYLCFIDYSKAFEKVQTTCETIRHANITRSRWNRAQDFKELVLGTNRSNQSGRPAESIHQHLKKSSPWLRIFPGSLQFI